MPRFRVNSQWAKISKVTDSLYISGIVAVNPATVEEYDITCVINATTEVPTLRLDGVVNMKLWLDDTLESDCHQWLDMVADLIQTQADQGGRTLVHCLAGVSRSATFCLAYLMKYERKSLREAYEYLAARRPVVRPNLNFWRQLIAFEKELRGGEPSVKLVSINGGCCTADQQIPDVYMTEESEEAEETDEVRPQAKLPEFDCVSIASSSRSFSEDLPAGPTEVAPIAVAPIVPPPPLAQPQEATVY